MIKNKELLYLMYWDNLYKLSIGNNLYGWQMSQKLTVEGFEWYENATMFNEDFMKSYNEDSNMRYFLEVDVQHPERLHELRNDLLI